jgi:hypothetical protein
MSVTKVTDTETREWMAALSDDEKLELKRRAMERRAVELLQPQAAPDFNGMTEQQIAEYCRKEELKRQRGGE